MKKTNLLISLLFTCLLNSKIVYSINKIVALPVYDSIAKMNGKSLLSSMAEHIRERQYDSVAAYYKKIKESSVDDEILGTAELYRSQKKVFEKKYFEAITVLYEALGHFKEIKAIDKEITTYLKLAELYKKIKSTDLSHETDSILMHQYLNAPISKLQKSLIEINHAAFVASLGKNEQALHLLKKIKPSNLSGDPYVLKYYYEELLKRYLKLEVIDSSYLYVKKIYEIPYVSFPEDEATKNIYYAMISYKEKKYKKALHYVNRAKKSTAFKYLEQFELIKLYKVGYLANRKLGQFEEALHYSVDYQSVRDSLKNFNLSVNASVLNFKLNRDNKIKALQAENKINNLILEEKNKFYIFSTFLVSVSLSLFIFIIVLHKKKKKRLKLQYENEKMKEIAAIKNNFIENLSHEIRTPITITTGYLRLISNNAMDYSKIIKYSDLTIRNNEQIMQMLNNSLTLIKLDNNPTPDKITSEKMDVFLKKTIFAFQGVSEIKDVPIYFKSNIKSNQIIDYNYGDLMKILNNMVSNALKYTSPTHCIYVHTYINENGLNLIIKDEGIGIDKKEQKLIFNRFYQSTNHSVTGGFGIGLSLVHELVTKLNGTIALSSKKNVGSIFKIQLPLPLENYLLYVDENGCEYKNISNEIKTPLEVSTHFPKILIVDDNIEMIGYLKELLAPTLNCTFAFDGKQALSLAKKIQYDIILTDLRMPIMDGHELKTVLDTLENYKTVPYIIMTASGEAYLENNKAELGINDYVIKPFEGIELITRINHYLEKDTYKKQLQSSKEETVIFNGAYSEFMEKINSIILENINNNDFTIQELAKSCGYSHKQFTQIVQEQTGLTPVKIILEVRLRKAYDLIVTDKYQLISEVFYTVGLNSRSYFNKVFTKRFGIKPGELIKKLKVKSLV